MGPRDERDTPQDDLFRNELANLIDPRHPLVKLTDRIDWSVFEREWSGLFASPSGRPAAPPRLIAGLLYLQHAYNLSDEAVAERWVENPCFQHFCGEKYFQHEFPARGIQRRANCSGGSASKYENDPTALDSTFTSSTHKLPVGY